MHTHTHKKDPETSAEKMKNVKTPQISSERMFLKKTSKFMINPCSDYSVSNLLQPMQANLRVHVFRKWTLR